MDTEPSRIDLQLPADYSQRVDRASTILTELYPVAKRATYQFEVYSRTSGEETARGLRDAMDKISIALQPDVEKADAEDYLSQCEVFLNAIAVAPIVWLSERKFMQVSMLGRRLWLYRLLLIEANGLTAPLLKTRLATILCKIEEAGGSGPAPARQELAFQALDLADQLYVELQPARYADRIFGILVFVVGILLGRGCQLLSVLLSGG